MIYLISLYWKKKQILVMVDTKKMLFNYLIISSLSDLYTSSD